MPVARQTITDGIAFVGSGHLTGTELLAETERLLADTVHLPPIRVGLVELSDIEDLTITEHELRRLAWLDETLAKWSPNALIAVVAPRDHDYGVARIWQAMVAGAAWTTQVFRSRAEADAWLGWRKKQRGPSPNPLPNRSLRGAAITGRR